MAKKHNQEANSQSSKLDGNVLQKLQELSRRQSECKFSLLELNSLDQFVFKPMQAKLPVDYLKSFLTLLDGHFFAVYKFTNFILKRTFEQKLF